MRNFILVALLLVAGLFSAQTASAQTFNEKSDFFTGVQYSQINPNVREKGVRFDGDNQSFGVNGSYTYYFANRSLGAGAEVSADFGNQGYRQYGYMGALTLKKRSGKVNPFVAAKAGVVHMNTKNLVNGRMVGDTGGALGLGVGLDVKINDKVSYRVIQGDYKRISTYGANQNVYTIGTGIVW